MMSPGVCNTELDVELLVTELHYGLKGEHEDEETRGILLEARKPSTYVIATETQSDKARKEKESEAAAMSNT